MAAQIRYHRARHQQQRVLIERLRHDVGELKKYSLNEQLQDENNRLRQHVGNNQFPIAGSNSNQQEAVNINGKRPRTAVLSYDQTGAQATTSSPRSIVAPLGPNRLTLPHGQTPPNLTSNGIETIHNPPSANEPQIFSVGLSQHRPASAFINKYAYVPPETPQIHRPQLTHAQIVPPTFKRAKPNPEPRRVQSQQPLAQNQAAQSMPPPPTPARFRTTRSSQASAQSIRHGQTQDLPSGYSDQQRRRMTKISSQTTKQSGLQTRQVEQNFLGTAGQSSTGINRFYPQVQQFAPPTSTSQISIAPMDNGPQRFFPAGTRAPSRAQQADHGGGQRVPFLPQDQLGDKRYI
ncbi:hypothetical protein C0995_003788 [Termitomyces sp. Mi166|nr:hypothetical protein C0995_003788 [Termitomyces sp. Mi166\